MTFLVRLTLTMPDAEARSVRSTARDDFCVDGAADMPLAEVLAGIVRNTLIAQFIVYGMDVAVSEATGEQAEG